MRIIISLVFMMATLSLTTGCATYFAKQSWNDAQQERAIRIESDGSEVRVGVDLAAMPYLKDNWGMATLAALVDGGLAYGAYLAIDELDGGSSSGGDNDNVNQGGRDASVITIDGDGNTVQVRGDESNFGSTGL